MKHVLDIPWGADELKEKYSLKAMRGGFMIYTGVLLPRELRPFRSEDFTLNRWNEDEANAHVSVPDKGDINYQAREDQKRVAQKIVDFYNANKPGVLIADEEGSGKKITLLLAIAQIARERGIQPWDDGANKAKLLIVAPKSALPSWRRTLKGFPLITAMARPLIITPAGMSKLLMAPAAARIAAKKVTKTRATARNGKPTIDWDFIILDQAHQLNNYPSPLPANAALLAKLNQEYTKGKTPFVLYSTPTPGSSPLHFHLMSKILAPALNASKEITPLEWENFLIGKGVNLFPTAKGNIWLGIPPMRGPGSKELTPIQTKAAAKKDLELLINALKDPKTPFVKDLTPSTSTLFISLPIEPKGSHKLAYKEQWEEFKTWLNRHLMGSDPIGYAQEVARYSRRVNNLKQEYILDFITDSLETNESRIYLKLPTLESVTYFEEKLLGKKIMTASLTSQNEDEASKNIAAFEEGDAQVLLVTDFLKRDIPNLTFIPKVILTEALMVPAFLKEQKLLFPSKPTLVYVPFIEKTIEEEIIKLFINQETGNSEITGDALTVEKLYRITAAKNPKPNRMS
jgi:hypothetical protein